MTLLAQVKTEPEDVPANEMRPVRINIQGTDGIGKSTFGAGAPSPIFIQAEDGLNFIKDVPRFPKANEWNDIIAQITTLATEDHTFRTLILDTTDAACLLAEARVCEKNGWESMETPGYGKAFTAVRECWIKLIEGLSWLYTQKNMNIILLSHVHIRAFSDPGHDSYDRWEMRCQKNVNALIKDWVDFNLFANYETNTVKEGNKTRGISYGNRSLFTKFAAAYDAKSRVDLPAKIDLSWDSFAQHYTAALAAPSTKTNK